MGPLTLHHTQGIGYQGRWYTWERVGSLSYMAEGSDALKITPIHGHWFESIKVPWKEITNADLLYALAAYAQRHSGGEEEYYSRDGILVTNQRLVVSPHEWPIKWFQPVKTKAVEGKYRINLLDKDNRQVHFLESESQERIQRIAEAINTALASKR